MPLKKVSTYPFHPLLFTLSCLTFLYLKNSAYVLPREFAETTLLALGGFAVLFAVIYPFFRSGTKTCFVLSYVMLMFFSDYHFYNAMARFPAPGAINRILLYALWLAGLLSVIYLSARAPRAARQRATRTLNILTLCFFLLTLGQLRHGITLRADSPANTPRPTTLKNSPDIYHLILDTYTSDDVLNELYQYDNSPFTARLEKMGFTVVKNAKPNYAITAASLASSLNMRYLDPTLPEFTKTEAWLYASIHDNQIMRLLKRHGYQTVTINGPFSINKTNRHYDISIRSHTGTRFLAHVISVSALANIRDKIYRSFDLPFHLRRNFLNLFREISAARKINGPKYVFVHIFLPHPPFLFKANGDAQDERIMTRGDIWRNRSAYVEQLRFVNNQILEVIDDLMAATPEKNPIIIIQGDHGPSIVEVNADKRDLYRQKFGILNAIYVPDEIPWPADLTPVNTFRILFNYYFEEALPLLENRHYYSTAEAPLDFTDITDIVSGMR